MKAILAPYWIGGVFGVGVTAFFTRIAVEAGVLPPWPNMPIALVGSCGALVAAFACIAAVAYQKRISRNPRPENNSGGNP